MTKSNPRVLYTGDNEGPAVMRLQTLIDNFNVSGGWQYRHNEEDMRLELDSRGWYSGLHDNGHYLALNIDKLGLEPHPTLYDKPGAVARELGGTSAALVSPPVANDAGRASTSRFWQWFEGVEANARADVNGAFMANNGYSIAHTGGGCLAWEKKASPESQWSVWVVDDDAGLGLDLAGAFQTSKTFGAMLCHDDSGEFINGPQGATIGECMAWATRAVADPDAMRTESVLADLADNDGAILHWQVNGDLKDAYQQALNAGAIKREGELFVHPNAVCVAEGAYEMPEPCKDHRDNGRGICCDCGAVL